MTFGGSSEPCALCSLHSIGKIGGAQNRSYSKLLCGLLTERLRISPDRCVGAGGRGARGPGGPRTAGSASLPPSQDLHQLLRHERGQRGLERLHLRLRDAPRVPRARSPGAHEFPSRPAPTNPASLEGAINGVETPAASSLFGLQRNRCRAGPVKVEPRPGRVIPGVCSLAFHASAPSRGPSLGWHPACTQTQESNSDPEPSIPLPTPTSRRGPATTWVGAGWGTGGGVRIPVEARRRGERNLGSVGVTASMPPPTSVSRFGKSPCSGTWEPLSGVVAGEVPGRWSS